ncbi:hypothetical protein AB0469_14665 [Streptomyces sp. NPDC093801]|uniref:hypothetical protein n=1 Tax=Streptomyces sp. NPDC093801 TaxID=3155203 RepID=UPI00344E84C7
MTLSAQEDRSSCLRAADDVAAALIFLQDDVPLTRPLNNGCSHRGPGFIDNLLDETGNIVDLCSLAPPDLQPNGCRTSNSVPCSARRRRSSSTSTAVPRQSTSETTEWRWTG